MKTISGKIMDIMNGMNPMK